MTKLVFFILFLLIQTIVNAISKASQNLKFSSELINLTSCQLYNEARTVVFFANNSGEDPIAVFWLKYNPQLS